MAVALGFGVLAFGVSLIYIGFRGLSVQEFWGSLLSGKLPASGSNAK